MDWVFWAADDLFFRFQLSGNAVLRETGQHPKSEPISGGINISFPIHIDSTGHMNLKNIVCGTTLIGCVDFKKIA